MITLEQGQRVQHEEYGEVEIFEVVTFSETFEVERIDGGLELQSYSISREKVKFDTLEKGIVAHDMDQFLSNISVDG